MTEPGLRERKREATAQALAQAAFELAREHGVDGFVIDDVARRAGYSRRTFANHFSCKEEAIAMVAFRGVSEATIALGDLAADVPLLDALHEVLKAQLTTEAFVQMRELVALSGRYPSLEPYVFALQHRMRHSAQETLRIAARDRHPGIYAPLLFGAVYGAITAALEGALDVHVPDGASTAQPGSIDYEEFLELAFDYLRSGF